MVDYRKCEHGFDHPGFAGSIPHSCDGCYCDDERDVQRGWTPEVRMPKL